MSAVPLDELLAAAGITAEQLEAFVDLYATSSSAVLVWSMGITQHRHGVEGVQAIVNVGLARGNVGRDGAGDRADHGHSGVQGGAEMARRTRHGVPRRPPRRRRAHGHPGDPWGFEVPPAPGLTAPEMIGPRRAPAGSMSCGRREGTSSTSFPDPDAVRNALEAVPLRVHADVVVTSQMLVPGEDVVLLPVATRYEQEGGGTSTTTERRVAFSPEILPPPGEARSESRLYADLVRVTRPELGRSFDWSDNHALRARSPASCRRTGIEDLRETGDAIQWGGRHLCAGGVFPTPNGRARFTVLDPPLPADASRFTVATRRGKQFNSMVWEEVDPLTRRRRTTPSTSTPTTPPRSGSRTARGCVSSRRSASTSATCCASSSPPAPSRCTGPRGTC